MTVEMIQRTLFTVPARSGVRLRRTSKCQTDGQSLPGKARWSWQAGQEPEQMGGAGSWPKMHFPNRVGRPESSPVPLPRSGEEGSGLSCSSSRGLFFSNSLRLKNICKIHSNRLRNYVAKLILQHSVFPWSCCGFFSTHTHQI